MKKGPDLRMQEAIGRVIGKVAEFGRVRQILLWFLKHKLDLPARTSSGEVVWRCPRYSTLHQLIANPAYGGAYGKTGVSVHYNGPGAIIRLRRKAVAEWLASKPGAHECYAELDRAGGDPEDGERKRPGCGRP